MGPIAEPRMPNMNLPAIRSKYPLGDRFALAINCCKSAMTPAEYIRGLKPALQFDEEFKKPHQQELGLKIGVQETGYLQLDPCIVHPFVRVHIIDMETGKYLAKKSPSKPGISNKESCALIDSEGNITNKQVDYLMPMSTRFYDMRITGQNMCRWHEEFVVNEVAPYICRPNVVLLFEILECNTTMIQEKDPRLNADHLYPIAWAYLRPLGRADIHLSRNRLQLYRFKFNYDESVAKARPFDHRTPAVFMEFNWPRRENYPSFLEVDLQFCGRCSEEIPRKHFSRAPWEKEIGLVDYTGEAQYGAPDEDDAPIK